MNVLMWARLQWDRVLGGAAAVAGAVLLIVGWVHVSGTGFVAEQLPYLASEGLGGVFLLGLGTGLWLSADMRDQWRELHAIRQGIDAQNAGEARPRRAAPTAQQARTR